MAIIDGNIPGVTPNSKSGSDIYNQDKGDLQKLRDSILESFKTQQATFLEISKNVKIVSDYIQLHPEFIDYTKLSESIKNAIGEPIIQEKTRSYGEIPDYNGILNDIYSAIIKTDKPENVNIRPESKEKTEKEGIEEEKKNPFEKMLDSIKNAFSFGKSEKVSPKSPLKPKPDDLLAMKDMASITAGGFLLLHNDLKEGSGSSLTSKALSAGGTGLAAGVGATLGAGLAGMVGGMFAGLSPMSALHLKEIVEELNADITYDDLKDDPQIRQAQVDGVAAYIKAYFIGQSASSIITEVISSVGPAIAESAKGFLGSLFGETKPESKVQLILNDLLDSMSSEDYLNDPDVLEAEKQGVIMYLMTYFTAQSTSLVINTAADAVSSAILTGAQNLLGALFGKDRQTSKVEDILNSILDSMTPEDYLNDPEIDESVKNGVNAYIIAYFVSQTSKEVLNGATEAIGSTIGAAVRSIFTGLFTGKSKEQEKLTEVVESIIDAIDVNDFVNDPDIHSSVLEGISAYVKSFFTAQAAVALTSATEDSVKNVVSGTGKGLIKGIASWFGVEDEETPLQQKLNSILELAVNDISVSKVAKSEATQNAIYEGISSYISAFFTAQFSSIKLDKNASDSFSTKFVEKTKTIMNSNELFDGIKAADFKPSVKSSIKSVMNSMMSSIEEDFIKNSRSKLKLSDSDYDKLKEAFLSTIRSSISESSVENNSIISGNNESDTKNIEEVVEKMNQIIDHLKNIESKENETINLINAENSVMDTEF